MGRYLITGITGFAGPHLANLLIKEGHEVHGLIRGSNGREVDLYDVLRDNLKLVTFHYGDLKNKDRMNKVISEGKYTGVFHLAAQSHPPTSFIDPIGTYQDNVMGSINLIEAIIEHSPATRLMFCSTSEVYGNEGRDGHLIKETDPLLPSNPYGNSKAAIDLYLQERFTNKKIKGFITRAFSHTGPRRGKTFSISSDAEQLARIIHDFTTTIKKTNSYTLRVGNLDTTRVVMDVRDTVKAYYLLMINKNTDGHVFNVCGNTPRKMQYYTDYLINITESILDPTDKGIVSIEKVVDPKLYRPIDIHYQHGDSTKLRNFTDWRQEYTIFDTLNDLLQYWMDFYGCNKQI